MEPKNSESWFARGKAEAQKGASVNDRAMGVFIVVVSCLFLVIFVAHQTGSTGFFTSGFGVLEAVLLYGSLVAWIITGALDGIFGQRLLSRLFDVFGGIIFIAFSLVWLLVVFPFDFTYFADVFPEDVRFLVQWISDDVARVVLAVGFVLLCVAAVYSPVAYKFVDVKRFKRGRK